MMSKPDSVGAIQETVRTYWDFSECIVDAVHWSQSGTQIDVIIDYVWKADGVLREVVDDRVLVRLRFGRVQEVEVKNRLNGVQLDEPERLDWGMGEISRLVIQETVRSRAYTDQKRHFFEATFRRESGAWISIVFADLQFSELANAWIARATPDSGR